MKAKTQRKKNKLYRITKREWDILYFLWHWKVASTDLLVAKFLPTISPFSGHRFLWRMTKRGYLTKRYLPKSYGFCWCLTKKGFQIIEPDLPELEKKSYKPEKVGHDFIVTAFHLGNWALDLPSGVELISEQQIDSLHPQLSLIHI